MTDRHLIEFFNLAFADIKQPNGLFIPRLAGDRLPPNFIFNTVHGILEAHKNLQRVQDDIAALKRKLHGPPLTKDRKDDTATPENTGMQVLLEQDFWRNEKEKSIAILCQCLLGVHLAKSKADLFQHIAGKPDIVEISLFKRNGDGSISVNEETAQDIRMAIVSVFFEYEASVYDREKLRKLAKEPPANPPGTQFDLE